MIRFLLTLCLLALVAKLAFHFADGESTRPEAWSEARIAETIRLVGGNPGAQAVPIAGGPPATQSPQTAPAPKRALLSFETFNRFDNELFGSMVLTWVNRKSEGQVEPDSKHAPHLGGEGCFVAAVLRNVKKGESYRVEVRGSGFISKSSTVVQVAEDLPLVTVGPTTTFDYGRLGSLTQTTPFDVTVTVQRNDEPPVERTDRWQAHQINDCPMRFDLLQIDLEGATSLRSFSSAYTVAGYVNENHPWIDTILTEALQTGYCRAFTGYAEGDNMLGPQIAAIWQALQNRRINYSNIATTTSSQRHAFQHVRFLDETIGKSQANCLDGSVMLASILRKIGLNVGVVLVPGHAYVAVYGKENRDRLFAIETTMLRNSNLADAVRAASDDSQYALAKVWPILNEGKDERYAEINLTHCREAGVQPIPFWRNASLTAFRQPSQPARTRQTPDHQPTPPGEARYAYSPVVVDSVAFDQERYYNGGGMMTAAQMDTYLNTIFRRLYHDKYRDEVPPELRDQIQRIEFCKQQSRHLEQIESVLRSDPSMFGKFGEWQGTISAINQARQSFNARDRPPRLLVPPTDQLRQGEKEQLERAYAWSLRTLKEVDPWGGNSSGNIDVRMVPAIIERTKKVCHALTLVSQLPLEY